MRKNFLFLCIQMFLVFKTKSMENDHTYELNEHSIKIASQATLCSIAWTLERNAQLKLLKGSTCDSQKSVAELKACCSAIEKIAASSKTTTEFQNRSKEVALSSYCAHTLYKKFIETLNQTLTPLSNKAVMKRHRRSSSETIAKKS